MTTPHRTGNKTAHGHHAGDDHHDHSHGSGHGHSHAPDVNDRNARAVALAGLLICSFMFAELIGGYLSGSLALMADALLGGGLPVEAESEIKQAGLAYHDDLVAEGEGTWEKAREGERR